MIEQDLLNAFNDSIDRLAAGQTLEDCLRAYPQYANQLRPMLNTGRLAHSAAPDAAEIAAAQARVRQRILSMTQPPKARPRPVLWQAATLAASLALVFLVTLTGSAALAQNSLPGDILYGMKILTEDVRLAFSGESTTLKGEFNERRIDEIRQLTAARRPAEVAFTGDITAASGNTWEIAGLPVTVTADTIGANDARVGETVKVTVATDDQGQIIAKTIEIETHIEPPPEPTLPPTAVPTRIPVTQTSIPTLTLTPSNTPTMTSTPTETATPTFTSSPTITVTPTTTPTMTVTFTPSPTLTLTPSPTLCAPQPPRGWVIYTIQPGDALSKLADRHGVFLSQVMEVNCLVDPGFIVVGERIYLPGLAPTAIVQPTLGQPPNNNDNGSGGGGGGSGGGGGQNDNSNDNHDDHSDDNSNDNH